ncbi:hypothetical protein TNCV_1048431 [Trichonephila clavipes]|nr:hypothetical protein TNCV_1048431 [Trichonephila clavipes]
MEYRPSDIKIYPSMEKNFKGDGSLAGKDFLFFASNSLPLGYLLLLKVGEKCKKQEKKNEEREKGGEGEKKESCDSFHGRQRPLAGPAGNDGGGRWRCKAIKIKATTTCEKVKANNESRLRNVLEISLKRIAAFYHFSREGISRRGEIGVIKIVLGIDFQEIFLSSKEA